MSSPPITLPAAQQLRVLDKENSSHDSKLELANPFTPANNRRRYNNNMSLDVPSGSFFGNLSPLLVLPNDGHHKTAATATKLTMDESRIKARESLCIGGGHRSSRNSSSYHSGIYNEKASELDFIPSSLGDMTGGDQTAVPEDDMAGLFDFSIQDSMDAGHHSGSQINVKLRVTLANSIPVRGVLQKISSNVGRAQRLQNRGLMKTEAMRIEAMKKAEKEARKQAAAPIATTRTGYLKTVARHTLTKTNYLRIKKFVGPAFEKTYSPDKMYTVLELIALMEMILDASSDYKKPTMDVIKAIYSIYNKIYNDEFRDNARELFTRTNRGHGLKEKFDGKWARLEMTMDEICDKGGSKDPLASTIEPQVSSSEQQTLTLKRKLSEDSSASQEKRLKLSPAPATSRAALPPCNQDDCFSFTKLQCEHSRLGLVGLNGETDRCFAKAARNGFVCSNTSASHEECKQQIPPNLDCNNSLSYLECKQQVPENCNREVLKKCLAANGGFEELTDFRNGHCAALRHAQEHRRVYIFVFNLFFPGGDKTTHAVVYASKLGLLIDDDCIWRIDGTLGGKKNKHTRKRTRRELNKVFASAQPESWTLTNVYELNPVKDA